MRIVILILISFNAIAEVSNDSIWHIWKSSHYSDSVRHTRFADYIWDNYMFSNPDSALILCEIQYDDAITLGNKQYLAEVLNSIATSFYLKGNYYEAIKKYEEALIIFQELDSYRGISNSLNNIGLIHSEKGDYAQAIIYYQQSLKIDQKHKDRKGIAASLNNIGLLYKYQNDYEQAIKNYEESLKIKEELNDQQGIAATLNNLGLIYQEINEYEKANEFLRRSLSIDSIIGNNRGVAGSYSNLGNLEKIKGNLNRAKAYYSKAREIYSKIGDKRGMAISYLYLAETLKLEGKSHEALTYGSKSLKLAKEIEALTEISNSSYLLYKLYKEKRSFEAALDMHELFIISRDSIQRDENKNEVIQQKFQYEYDKKAAADSVAYTKEQLIKELEIKTKETELEANRNQKTYLFSGLFILLLFSLFILNRIRLINKQKSIIEVQKKNIELKQKETQDSITYARRLQQAILPSRKEMHRSLKNGFVLYRPKDIVAGDFYWMEEYKNRVYFAAADCTGHGVPGAMMSVICSNALSKSLLEENKESPSEILDLTKDIVITRLGKSGESINDGMDIGLCSLTFNDNLATLSFSGANNPLWIIPHNSEEVIEIKGDKQPIGKHHCHNNFTNHTITLSKQDRIYVLTDGFSDQFGGDTKASRVNGGKKFKSSNLKKLLIDTSHMTMDEQKEYLETVFNQWKGDLDQIDDVCIIGVEI